jgi:hypothetical protein
MAEAQAASLKDILSRRGLKNEDLDKEIPSTGDNKILQIAHKIEDWKVVGHHLGIPKEKLKAIEKDNDTEEQRRIAILHTWMEREGSRATYLRLVTVLNELDRNDLVELTCKLISSGIVPLQHSLSVNHSSPHNCIRLFIIAIREKKDEKQSSPDMQVIVLTEGYVCTTTSEYL